MVRSIINFLILFSLYSIVNSIKLECAFENFGNLYYCSVKVTFEIISKDDRTITGISVHKDGKGDKDVLALKASSITIKFMPKGLEHIFSKLHMIDISETGLEEITKDDLAPFGNKLKELRLESNEIKSIEADFLSENPNVVSVILSKNKITIVEAGALSTLKKLEYIGFAKNPCHSVEDYYDDEEMQAILLEIESKCAKPIEEVKNPMVDEIIAACKDLTSQLIKIDEKVDRSCMSSQ